MCMDLKQWKLLNFEAGVLYTLEQFFESQQERRSLITQKLDEFWSEIIEIVQITCTETLESLEEGLFGARVDAGQADSGRDQASPRAENFRYTVMASKRVVQKRIFFFLRLCDYVIFSTLQSMVVESVTELLDRLSRN